MGDAAADGPGRSRTWRERVRAVPWLVRRAPWWVVVMVGVVLVALGLLLLTRPLSALGTLGLYVGASCIVSGVADLLSAARTDETGGPSDARTTRRAISPVWSGVLWIVVGIAVIAWLGRYIGLFAPTIAVVLVGSGVIAIVRLIMEPSGERVVDGLFGAAEIIFGLLALLWPDATLIVLAVLFGARTALYGIVLVARGIGRAFGWRSGATDESTPEPSPGPRRIMLGVRIVAAAAVLALALGTAYVSNTLRAGTPTVGAFYDTPEDLPDEPGVLVRTEPYDGNLPAGLTGTKIFYTTTDEFGVVVPATGVLAVPSDAEGEVPLITWAHGTVGVARHCAPSIGPDAIISGGLPAADDLASLGWAIVASDYPGMGTEGAFPYLIGEGEGRAVLDAARAARQVGGVSLTDETVVWGHSQGGHGALWAGQLAATYAPELHVLGTAALAPAAEPHAMAETVLAHPDSAGASLAVAYTVDAYTKYYPELDLDDVVVPSGRPIVREAAARCTGQGGTLITVLAGLAIARDQPIVDGQALDDDFGRRLEQNAPTGPWSAPLFIGQGADDEVIPIRLTEAYVGELEAAGVDVGFHTYPGGTHMSVLEPGSELGADVVVWTQGLLG